MKHLYRLTATALCLLAAALFTACSNDDNDTKEPAADLTLPEIEGQYEGTFDFIPTPSSINPSPEAQNDIAISLRVEDGRIVIPQFPAAQLVTALMGEERAEQLLPLLGTISYELGIGTPTANETQLSAALTAPELRIDMLGIISVVIDIEAPGQMTCTRSGALAFTLKTTHVQMDATGGSEPVEMINELKFELTRK